MIDWPDGPRLFKHFRDLPGVLRLRDLHSYVRSHGFSEDLMPAKSFQGIPLHHRGSHVGNFFVCGKEDGPEFTSEDEEVLVMFAAQAATAIANARAFRDEQRTRLDMEALVDTSPVGVAVFDAGSDGDDLDARFTFTIPVTADSVTGAGAGFVRSSSHPTRMVRE